MVHIDRRFIQYFRYGCVIGEMGVRDHNDKPYPSTGFTSVYVMAHEIGHNLGELIKIIISVNTQFLFRVLEI